jgi:predicted outer membrane repeat protein
VGSDLVVQSMALSNNTTDGAGGAIYVEGGSYTGTGNLVRGNTTGTSGLTSGGGLYTTGAAVTLSGSRYDTNTVTFAGAGVDIKDAVSLSIDQCFFVDNQGGIYGTGVTLESPPVGSTFTSNTVAHNLGGSAGANGLYLNGTGSLDISNSIFAFNGEGGSSLADGVQCSGPTVTLNCNDAYGNTAAAYGGCPDPTGTDGNLAVDPGFCDLANSDYRIADTSPVAAAQTGCGTMGADAETCGATAVDPPTPLPRRLALERNVPNPFNPRTEIAFDLPRTSHVQLRVFDLRGRLVRVLFEGDLPGGHHVEIWNGVDGQGRSVASGTYFYELLADGQRRVRKMGLLK